MRISHNGKSFIAKINFDERFVLKNAKWAWCPLKKIWHTTSPSKVTSLENYETFCDSNALDYISKNSITVEKFKDGVVFNPPQLMPLPFQIDALQWATTRSKSYLALDPGLGKTICAAMIVNYLKEKSVYVCPPFLLGNVEAEFTKWGEEFFAGKVGRIKSSGSFDEGINVLLVPDSIINRDAVLIGIEKFSGKCLLVDEAHRFKSHDALRTKSLFKIEKLFNRTVLMSGTPMPNRPKELWAPIHHCAWEVIDHAPFPTYGIRYCGGYKDTFGWNFEGATNVDELFSRLKQKFMLRITKDTVLKDLPAKRQGIVVVDSDLQPELRSYERQILKDHLPETLGNVIGDEHIATYRRKLGVQKAKFAAEFVRDILENTKECVLLFGIHREAITILETELKDFKPLIVTGSVDKDERFRRAKLFQNSDDHRLMILNIQAGGVGFNLTRATRIVFSEFSWVPSDNSQAEDRAHRIGQNSSVLCQYIVFKDSLDARVLHTVMNKEKLVKQL
jgi:SWI/SNF-related matrix-associated actin-dependent regulator 1 of chromatin subfamily A